MRHYSAVTLMLFLVAGFAFAGEKRSITETDLYQFRWIGDPQISSDGSKVAYTLVNVNAKHDGYDTAIWMVPANGGVPHQLTAGPRDGEPRWSPDGRYLAFTRSIDKDGKTQPPQVWLLPLAGGEARALTDLPKGAGGPVWSPDGSRLAMNSSTSPKDLDTKDAKEPEKSDVRVITRAVFRTNGGGFLDFDKPSHIWVAEVPKTPGGPVKPKQITTGRFTESDPLWSKDGTKIYFTSNRTLEPYYDPPKGVVYVVSSEGGDTSEVLRVEGELGNYVLSPDGGRLAYEGALSAKPIRSYTQPDLFIAELGNKTAPNNVTEAYDFDIAGGISGDQHPPRGGLPGRPVWSRDGKWIIALAGEEGRSNLKRIDAGTGKVEALTSGDHDMMAFSATPDASKFAAVISTPANIGDLYLVDGNSGKLQRLTNINEELFSQLRVTEPETIWYNSFDGKRIQAWIQKPPDFDPAKKYPLILNIHGGPHAAYGFTFDHEFQWMAAKGYVVLYPNPRGSTTYGQDFGNIIQYKYPGDDYKDLMAGVDAVVAMGYVDAEKLAVTGGSGGGLLTNWVITQTTRFKAAASQRSIADWRDFWYNADFALFRPTWFRGAPWQQEEDFKARSPITYIDRVTTPLMLIEGESDLRTPPAAGGEQMFRALKYLRKPTVMVRFPGESHELSRSGKPTHRVERLQHIVGWFDQYLMGKPVPAYEIAGE
jgi:dipeptidyl aminopeptidase/acylaminoacyl peptidase